METRYQGVFDCAIYWEDQLIEKAQVFQTGDIIPFEKLPHRFTELLSRCPRDSRKRQRPSADRAGIKSGDIITINLNKQTLVVLVNGFTKRSWN